MHKSFLACINKVSVSKAPVPWFVQDDDDEEEEESSEESDSSSEAYL
jgi:hypothetical protein